MISLLPTNVISAASAVLGDVAAEPDPISVLAAVALTKYKQPNTRLRFADYKIFIQEPSSFEFIINWQGLFRRIQGASREDLSIIKRSIEQVAFWYDPHLEDNEQSKCVKKFFGHVKEGLQNGIGRTYSTSEITRDALKSWEELIDTVCVRKTGVSHDDTEVDNRIRGLWIQSEIDLINAYLQLMNQHKNPSMNNLEALLEQKSKELKTSRGTSNL